MIDIAIEVMDLLKRSNCDAYLVGGSVRDLFLNKPIKDIDIATDCEPDDVEHIALINGIQFIPTGVKHGTVTIIYKNVPIEITTFRVDVKCYGRKADVQFVCTIEEDLSRRDFTINAMAIDIDGNIIDPFNGKNDLVNCIVRAVGEPDRRFEEDKLRIMRAIRFASVLDFNIDSETFKAIKRTNLIGISSERIRDELIKILESPNRYRGLVLLDETGVLSEILSEVTALKGVEADSDYHPEKDTFLHTMISIKSLPSDASLELSLAVLFHDIGKPAKREVIKEEIHFYEHEILSVEMSEKILYRLKFSRETIDKVKWLIGNHMKIFEFPKMRKAKKIRLIQEPHFNDLLELLKADIMGTYVPCVENLKIVDFIYDYLKEYEEEIKKRPILIKKERLITGFDILNLGVKPGKVIGDILEIVEDEVLEGNIKTREEALEYAKTLIFA